jgi:hypothetical protein
MRAIGAVLFSSIAFSLAFAQQGTSPATTPVPAVTAKSVSDKQPTATPANSLGLTVARAVFAKGIDENGPVDPGTTFTTDVKRLYCITQIKGAKDSALIEHRWFVNDKPVFTLPLAIKSINWRTQSCITVRPEYVGEVKVVVVLMPKEEPLTTMTCTIQ